jgi:hypothetical protein
MTPTTSVKLDGLLDRCDGDEIVGFALSQNRGWCWFLWTFGVLTDR